MTETSPPSAAGVQAGIAAALLAVANRLHLFSLLLTVTAGYALLGVALTPWARSALGIAVIAGLAAQYWALRIAFDRPIFAAWAERWQAPTVDPAADLSAFDMALAESGLGPAPSHPPRTLGERLAGVRRLLRRLAICCMVQLLGWLLALLAAATLAGR